MIHWKLDHWRGQSWKSGFYQFCTTQLFSDSPPYLSCFPPIFLQNLTKFYKILPNFTKAYQIYQMFIYLPYIFIIKYFLYYKICLKLIMNRKKEKEKTNFIRFFKRLKQLTVIMYKFRSVSQQSSSRVRIWEGESGVLLDINNVVDTLDWLSR